MNYEDELYHHGVKGQKWGVRRFQNKDGSLTKEGKSHYHEMNVARGNITRNLKYTDDKNEIVRTLSSHEKDLLGADRKKDWIEKEHEIETLANLAKSFVIKEGDKPLSFIEVWTNGGHTGQIALATRNDPKYRGKGLSSKNVESVIKWANQYGYKSIDELEWIAEITNTASNALANKFGFVKDEEKSSHWDGQYNFYYKKVGKRNV